MWYVFAAMGAIIGVVFYVGMAAARHARAEVVNTRRAASNLSTREIGNESRIILNDGDFAVTLNDEGEPTLVKRPRAYAVREVCSPEEFLRLRPVNAIAPSQLIEEAKALIRAYDEMVYDDKGMFYGESRHHV